MHSICGMVSFAGEPVAAAVLARMVHGAGARDGVMRTWEAGAAGFAALVRGGTTSTPDRRPHAGNVGGTAVILVADVRLDNRHELRHALALDGESGEMPSDETLMAAAYERWGTAWHRHLDGAFAAAVWDPQAGRLVLLRDRVGERGLYWCCTGSRFLFASEPAQLVASGCIASAPHEERILAYLLGAPAEPTWSYFDDVQRVPEGGQVRVSGTGAHQVVLDRYWDWTSVAPETWRGPGAAPELARRLQQAVERRLAHEGESGVLLSGGLDSSGVAALAAGTLARRGRRLHAFTWTSRSGDCIDETGASRTLIASRPNVVEHPVEADDLWPLSRYPEAFQDASAPDTNAYPDLLLATLEAARDSGVTVLMNGIGGDTVAGWLAPELTLLLHGELGALWRRWRRAGLGGATLPREVRLLARRPRWPAWLSPRAERLARQAELDRPATGRRTLVSRDSFRRSLLANPVNAASLERFERLGRRCGVRVEAPWHDAGLAALVLGLPDRAVGAAPPAKSVVRAALQGELPARLLEAPTEKTLASGLHERGLLGGAGGLVEQMLSRSRLEELGLVVASRLLAAYRDHATRRAIAPRLWEVLTTEGWLLASARL